MKAALATLRRLPETLVAFGGAVLVTLLAALVLAARAPQPVVRGTVSLGIPTPLIYQLPVFFPFGLLAGEVLWEGLQSGIRSQLAIRSGWLLVLSLIAVLRLSMGIPISGHAMLITYYVLDEALARSPRHPLRILIGIAIGVEVVVFKVWIWQDSSTLVAGFGAGMGIWLLGQLALRLARSFRGEAKR